MKIEDILKITSGILFCINFLLSIFLGMEYGSFIVFLSLLAATFVFSLLVYAAGEVIFLLKIANGNTYEIYKLLKTEADKNKE